MTNYQNGKIYKIYCELAESDICYIGATCTALKSRLGWHKYYLDNGRKHDSSKIFDMFGYDNCSIKLIEEYPCNSRKELLKRRREWQLKFHCVNEHEETCEKTYNQKSNEYYHKHKNHINRKVSCICHAEIAHRNLKNHLRSRNHKKWLALQQ